MLLKAPRYIILKMVALNKDVIKRLGKNLLAFQLDFVVYVSMVYVSMSRFFSSIINLFHTTGLSYTPWKHQKTRGFLMFSAGIQKYQWYDMA